MNFNIVLFIIAVALKALFIATTFYSATIPFWILNNKLKNGFMRTFEIFFMSIWVVLESVPFEKIDGLNTIFVDLFESRIIQTFLVMILVSIISCRMYDVYYLTTTNRLNPSSTLIFKVIEIFMIFMFSMVFISIFVFVEQTSQVRVYHQGILLMYLITMLLTSLSLKFYSKETGKNELFMIYFRLLLVLTIHQSALLAGVSTDVQTHYSFNTFVLELSPHSPLVLVFCVITLIFINNLVHYFKFMNRCLTKISHEKNDEESTPYRSTLGIFQNKQNHDFNDFDPIKFIKTPEFHGFIRFLKREKLDCEFNKEKLMNVGDAFVLKSHFNNLLHNLEEREIPLQAKEPQYLLNILEFSGLVNGKLGKQEIHEPSMNFSSLLDKAIGEIDKILIKKYLDEYLITRFSKTEIFKTSKIRYFNGCEYSELDLPYGLISEERFSDWKNHRCCTCPGFGRMFRRGPYKTLKEHNDENEEKVSMFQKTDFEMVEILP